MRVTLPYRISEGTEVPAYCVPQREKNQSYLNCPNDYYNFYFAQAIIIWGF